MRVSRGLVALVAAAGALAPAAPALAVGDPLDRGQGLPDRDVRTAKLRPTSAQQNRAESLGTQVAWNQFGTPSSLVDPGDALATGVAGATPEAAARAWLGANRSLFRLASTDGLELVGDSALAGDVGHAVTLRQVVGGLQASGGGQVTIGVQRDGAAWRVISAAGTILGDTTLAGKPTLAPQQAVQRAAADVGERRSLGQIDRVAKAGGGYKAFALTGLSDLQRTRAVAFPTVGRGFVPAYETIVLDTEGAEPAAYRTFIDARDGAVLARESLVEQAADEPLAAAVAAPVAFNGELPATDGGCGPRHGPYTVADGSGVRAIDVFANADAMAQDIVLRLYRGTTLVAAADTITTPERIRHAPTGGVPAGDYFVEVCEFRDAAPPVEPRTYTGTITLDDSAPPSPFTARWRVFPSTPLHNTLAAYPWNNPDTDVRENWCWKATATAADCDDVVGNLASRAPWDHDVKANAPTNTTLGNNARTAESWTNPSLPGPTQFRPVSAARDYTFPFTDAWNNARLQPRGQVRRGVRARPGVRHLGVGHEPVRAAQPDARLVLPARLHGGELERPGFQLRRDRGVPRERPGARQRAGRRGGPAAARLRRGAQQREHVDAARRLVVDHQHVPVAADRGRVLRSVRRRRLRRGRDRPRVRPHDREPHDRQGRSPLRPSRGRDGRDRPAT